MTTAATGDQTDPSTAGDDLDESVVVDNTTDLVTVKTLPSGDATPDEGDTIVFMIEVTNNGVVQATNVSLTDSIPDGFTLTGDTTTQGSYVDGLWTIGTLNVGETATLTLTGTIDAGQGGNRITNVVTAATGDQVDPTTDGDSPTASVTVNDTIDLITTKGLIAATIRPNEGDLVTFVINVLNNGSATTTGVFATATNVSLTDFLPDGLTATDENGTVSQGSYDPATGIFDIGTLAVGESATLFLEGTVDAGQAGNAIINSTTAATGNQVDPSTVGDDLEESVVVENAAIIAFEPAIGLAKSASDVSRHLHSQLAKHRRNCT